MQPLLKNIICHPSLTPHAVFYLLVVNTSGYQTMTLILPRLLSGPVLGVWHLVWNGV